MGGMYVPYGREIPHVHYATCFRENIGQTMFVSFELLSPYGMDYLHLMRTLEEKFMEGWIGEHLAYEEAYHMLVSPMMKSYNTHLVIFLRIINIWEGRTVIFPISHELVGIFNFVLLLCLMNKRTMEVHNSP